MCMCVCWSTTVLFIVSIYTYNIKCAARSRWVFCSSVLSPEICRNCVKIRPRRQKWAEPIDSLFFPDSRRRRKTRKSRKPQKAYYSCNNNRKRASTCINQKGFLISCWLVFANLHSPRLTFTFPVLRSTLKWVTSCTCIWLFPCLLRAR